MSDVFWTAMFAALPGILTGLATLIIILAKIGSLHTLVNGKFTEMLQLVATSSKTEGRVDGLVEAARKTTMIEDRRDSHRNDVVQEAALEVAKDIKEIKDVVNGINGGNK